MPKDVIIACDFSSKKELMDFLQGFGEYRPYLKIGMELFYSQGASIVSELKNRGHKIFLDLKMHDIPNTVAKTTAVLANLGVDMLNLHCAGGSDMMRLAQRQIDNVFQTMGHKTDLIAVTQLTSISQKMMEDELLIPQKMEDVVLAYAKNAQQCGLSGVVCSAWEADIIHTHIAEDFLTITPAIRFKDDKQDDQVRIMTPRKAREYGCDYIVVGRAITSSDNPVKAYEYCLDEFLK